MDRHSDTRMYLVFICAPGLRMVFGGEDQMDVSHYQGGKWGVGQHFAHRLVSGVAHALRSMTWNKESAQ
jgi:hypothetical protein